MLVYFINHLFENENVHNNHVCEAEWSFYGRLHWTLIACKLQTLIFILTSSIII